MNIDSSLCTVEQRMNTLISEQFHSAACQHVTSSCASTLQAVGQQALSSSLGGKRLRALLLLAAFDAETSNKTDNKNPNRRTAIDLACALEVFQTAALIHDDIIDESPLRRGKPSAYQALATVCGNMHIGSALAVMLGDLLATQSFNIARLATTDSELAQDLLESFARMQQQVSIGQVLDLSIEMMPLDDPQQLAEASLNVFRWKTASYSTIAPLELGFIAAHMPKTQAHTLAQAIGEPLGIAFQIADDLLDIMADSNKTGKPQGGDIREGKRAILLADALTTSTQQQQALLREAYMAPERDEAQVAAIMQIYRECGTIACSKQRIATLWQQSQLALSESGLSNDAQAIIQAIMQRFVPESYRS